MTITTTTTQNLWAVLVSGVNEDGEGFGDIVSSWFESEQEANDWAADLAYRERYEAKGWEIEVVTHEWAESEGLEV